MEQYQIHVDYDRPIESAAKDCGFTSVRDEALNFTTARSGKVNLLVSIMKGADLYNDEKALKAIEEAGYRPATIEELLAFAATHQYALPYRSIVALGSVAKDRSKGTYAEVTDDPNGTFGGRYYPPRRELELTGPIEDSCLVWVAWGGWTCFLVVHEEISSK